MGAEYVDMAELDIQIEKKFKDIMSGGLKEAIQKAVEVTVDKKIDGFREGISVKTDAFITEHGEDLIKTASKEAATRALSGEIGKFIDFKVVELTQKLKNLKDEFYILRTNSTPEALIGRINSLAEIIGKTKEEYTRIRSQFETFMHPKAPEINHYSNDEIKSLWMQTGLTLKEVQSHFNIEKTTASRYVNGEVSDPITRLRIYKYLSDKVSEAQEILKSPVAGNA